MARPAPIAAAIGIAVVAVAVFFTMRGSPERTTSLAQVTIVIEALECQQFILFFDPALDALEDSVMVTIAPNEEQALVLPSRPDYDLKFKDAFWSSWEVGTMGRPEGEAISYDVLAVGRTASCQIDRGEIPFPLQGIFNSARRI